VACHFPRAILLCVALAASASAEPKPADSTSIGRAVTAECQMVVVSTKQALELVPKLSGDATKAATWAQVLEMVAKGEATLAGTLLARGRLGDKLTASSIEEVRYATEFDPPPVPDNFFDPQRLPKNEAWVLEVLKNWPYRGISPTAFETRNTGQTMELGTSETIGTGPPRCQYVLQDVRLKQFDKYDSGRLANGERLEIQQPRFTAMNAEGSAWFESGKPELVAAHRLPGDEQKVELVVLTLKYAKEKLP
jgi:hypothetical protein